MASAGDDDTTPRIARTLDSLRGVQRFVVLHVPPAGPGAVRNYGARAAAELGAQLVAYLDGDDWWQPQFLAHTEALLGRCPDAVAAFASVLLRDEAGHLRSVRVRRRSVYGYADLCRYKSPMLTASNLMVRLAPQMDAGGFSEDIVSGQDWELLLKLTRGGARVRRCPYPLVNYRRRRGSITTDVRRLMDGLLAVEQLHPDCRRARHWWWLLRRMEDAGEIELAEAAARRMPHPHLGDYLSLQFGLYRLFRRRRLIA